MLITATFSNIASVQFVSMIVLEQELAKQVSFKGQINPNFDNSALAV